MPRILVADDNTNIQKMVTLAFHDRGVEVTSVGNGEAAVRRLPDLNPDLILADIFMPVRNGYELCEYVKKDSKYSHIPVILLVGAFDPLDEKEARRVGADGVLKKPFIPPDPLIAMVTSTLEKNPKLAAEMAKAREARETPAPPPPPVIAEVPKKIDVKPLPEFPEPSPDEASLAYGFGVGRRDLEDDGHDESAAARAPQPQKQAEEEFDGASTTNDWRRSAMDFEVPAEASLRPAFAADDESESAPVAHESVASSHVAPPSPVFEAEPPKSQSVIEAEAIEIAPVMEEGDASPADVSPADAASIQVPDSWQLSPDESATIAPVAEVEGDPHSEWASDVPDIVTPASAAEHSGNAGAPENHFAEPAAPEASEAPEVHADASPIPQPQADEPKHHWMDLMGAVSGQPQSDWLSLIQSQSKPAESNSPAPNGAGNGTQKSFEPANDNSTSPLAASSPEHALEHSVEVDEVAEAENHQPSQEHLAVPHSAAHTLESSAEQHVEPAAQEPAQNATGEEEDWFFADEPEPAATAVSEAHESASPVSGNSTPSHEAHESAVSQPSVSDASHDEPAFELTDETPLSQQFEATVSEPVAISNSTTDAEVIEEPSAASVASTEPELIAPPAVRVTPEPLLIDEFSPRETAAYGHVDQQIAPPYEFLPEVEASAEATAEASAEATEEAQLEHKIEDNAPGNSSSEEPSHQEMAVSENLSHESSDLSLSTAPPADSDWNSLPSLEESTPQFVRPTTREQLAHIPFLNPPHDFHETEEEKSKEKPSPAAETVAVNAVVQRILDKIEPQLHDLLAQNLKPLIENLVHTELHKRDR